MTNQSHLMYIHGLAGTSQGFKATFLRSLYPDLQAPDFPGDFWERMALLDDAIGDSSGWTLIGSSLGGLMAAVFTCLHPEQVERLVLLAPALPFFDLEEHPLPPAGIPVVIVHGRQDEVVPMDRTRSLAQQLFPNLTMLVFDATHDLNPIVPQLEWPVLLGA